MPRSRENESKRMGHKGAGLARYFAGFVVLAGVAPPLAAAPLSPETCEALKGEHATLLQAGAHEAVKKGPQWAKANLATAKVKEAERFIELQEQLLFRCGLAKLRDLPVIEAEETSDPPAASEPAAKEAAGATAAPAPAPPVPARKAPTKGKANAAANTTPQTAGEEPEAKPKPKTTARAKPKPKVDDAYRPPAKAVEPPSE